MCVNDKSDLPMLQRMTLGTNVFCGSDENANTSSYGMGTLRMKSRSIPMT